MQEPELKKTNKKSIFLNTLLILCIFVGLFLYMFFVDGPEKIWSLLQMVDYKWVFFGLLCLLGVWLCETLTLHIPLKKIYPEERFSTSIKATMIGLLFNNITPFSSGGQPIQAYELTKTGKRVSDSLSVLAMKFIITQIALVIFTLSIVVFQFSFFINLFKDYLWIVILGFGINIIAIVVVILMGFYKSFIMKLSCPVIRFLGKLHVFKNPDHTIEKLNESVENFSNQFKAMKEQKKIVLQMFIIAVIQSLLYYSITYMVYRAFGNSGVEFFQIITVQAFLLLIMTFIPTPGSGLGAEGGFLLLFNSIFLNGTINMSILFWRIYTFYLPIIIGAFFLIPRSRRKKAD